MTFKYRAFISYAHVDGVFAARLHKALERLSVGTDASAKKSRLGRFFRDDDELSAGELGPAIEAALSASDALIVVCTPASAQSRWVSLEIERFRQVRPNGRIVPVLPDGSADLELKLAPALRQRAEMLAVDVERFGFDAALIKIAAALLGVDYDDLYQREARALAHERRRARLTLSLGAMLCVLAIAGLGGVAWLSHRNVLARSELLATFADQEATRGRQDLAALLAISGARPLNGGIGPQSERIHGLLMRYLHSPTRPLAILSGLSVSAHDDSGEATRLQTFLLGSRLIELDMRSGAWRAWTIDTAERADGTLPTTGPITRLLVLGMSAAIETSGGLYLMTPSAVAVLGGGANQPGTLIGATDSEVIIRDAAGALALVDIATNRLRWRMRLAEADAAINIADFDADVLALRSGDVMLRLDRHTGAVLGRNAVPFPAAELTCLNLQAGLAMQRSFSSASAAAHGDEGDVLALWRVSERGGALNFSRTDQVWRGGEYVSDGRFGASPDCRSVLYQDEIDTYVQNALSGASIFGEGGIRASARYIDWSPRGEYGFSSSHFGLRMFSTRRGETEGWLLDTDGVLDTATAWADDESALAVGLPNGRVLVQIGFHREARYQIDEPVSALWVSRGGARTVVLGESGQASVFALDPPGAGVEPLLVDVGPDFTSYDIAPSLESDGLIAVSHRAPIQYDGADQERELWFFGTDEGVTALPRARDARVRLVHAAYGHVRTLSAGRHQVGREGRLWNYESPGEPLAICGFSRVVMKREDGLDIVRAEDEGRRSVSVRTSVRGEVSDVACGERGPILVRDANEIVALDNGGRRHVLAQARSDYDYPVAVDRSGEVYVRATSETSFVVGRIDGTGIERTFSVSDGLVDAAALSPRGDFLLLQLQRGMRGSRFVEYRLYDVASGVLVSTLNTQFALFSPGGEWLYAFEESGVGHRLRLHADDADLIEAACAALPRGGGRFSETERRRFATMVRADEEAPCARRGLWAGRLW